MQKVIKQIAKQMPIIKKAISKNISKQTLKKENFNKLKYEDFLKIYRWRNCI